MSDKFIQIKEAAEILGVSKLTLRNWDESGKLTAYRHPMNNYRVYKMEDIHSLVEKIKNMEKPTSVSRRNSSSLSRKKHTPKTYNLKDLLSKN